MTLPGPRTNPQCQGEQWNNYVFFFSFALCGYKDAEIPSPSEEEEEEEETQSADRASGLELGVSGTGGHASGGRGPRAQMRISFCFLLL